MNSPETTWTEENSSCALHLHWYALCERKDLVANSGVVAWLEGKQIALFYLPDTAQGEQLFAIDNRDPKSGANVIGRGLTGQIAGELVIASPLYKQHFRLHDGSCIEYPEQRLEVWPVRLNGERVEIAV
ncbi:nitrite reductase small subunit [Pseudomonas syringae pv. tomato]|uniref:Nitrite reductase small subunit n=1 Tax=Pseudomonas syringae pv. tomato TaxID=323 RepID=A0AB36KNU7_PSEUB|nr:MULTISPECIES: nitrite reductase small subunit NirD [Pseudomonas syringae group]KPB79982.1 Nitrite reductase [NADPH] [Pseudomonas syringae pv. maculicola]MBI6849573.1 nitrite reductase small subunit NirD [Pseudomonas syringae]MBX6509903.1 nitrite reductase small subunit NirD [Pseudomonas syringae pv. tomato]OPE57513.1 nitrite reductase small subunit [Pseudomonas syringae pv. tomato]RMV02529.1 Nitrite reductase, small subunit [Pseudomonas syringae pv. tomato]